jgi:hypothetical protein
MQAMCRPVEKGEEAKNKIGFCLITVFCVHVYVYVCLLLLLLLSLQIGKEKEE